MPGYEGNYQTCPCCKSRIYVEWGCLGQCSNCGYAEGARCERCRQEYDPDLPHCPDCGPGPDEESEFPEENPPYLPPDEGVAPVELCPYCGSDDIRMAGWGGEDDGEDSYRCGNCRKLLGNGDLVIIPPQTIRGMDEEPSPLPHMDPEHGCTLSEIARMEEP